MHDAFAVLLFVTQASAYIWNTHAFTYIGNHGQTPVSFRRSGSNECQLCIDDEDCLPFNSVKCEFYLETNKILEKDEEPKHITKDPKLKSEVDALIFSILERAKNEDFIKECIPYVSKYTDCDKDNVCLGCKTCECNMMGRWNCTINQTCRPNLIRPVADQRTLMNVNENFNKNQIKSVTRRKRSIYHSIRSLEDMDIEQAINDKHDNKDKIYEINNGVPVMDLEPENTNAVFIGNQNINSGSEELHNKNDKELVKLIVNSLIHDALPDVFKEHSLDFENNRVKRWLTNNKTNTAKAKTKHIEASYDVVATTIQPGINTVKTKITFDELSDWLDHMHPLSYIAELQQSTVDKNSSYESEIPEAQVKLAALDQISTSADLSTGSNIITPEIPVTASNPDYLAFDEVYNNIQVENKTYIRRKPPLDHAAKYYDDDINMYDDKYGNEDTSGAALVDYSTVNNIVQKIVVATSTENTLTNNMTEYSLPSPTEVVVDLLETANKVKLESEKENQELNNNKIDNLDKLDQVNSVNIMKRDVSFSNQDPNKTDITSSSLKDTVNTTETPVSTSEQNTNSTSSIEYLKSGVLDPLDDMLENKQREIREIFQMRERLVNFIQKHPDHANLNISSKNAPLTLYKLEYTPHQHHELHNLRESNFSLMDKVKLKLKRDIYEVIKDVIIIRKQYNESTELPPQLNFLIRALKHYIHKTGFHPKGNTINYRRSNINGSTVSTLIIKIFEILLKNMPHSDALEPLSPHSRRMIKRFIRKNYVDDFAGTGLKIYDSQYNLTNDLRNVATQWQILTSIITTSPRADQLNNMKRLHLLMGVDIGKMNDALALIDFARGRRMIPIDEVEGEIIVMNIHKTLDKVRNKILSIVPQSQALHTVDLKDIEKIRHKKKDSFFSQVKRLLRNSKADILKLLRRKVSKSDVVKQIARKNIEEMTKRKLQDTMEKWQTNLNIISTRDKRSVQDYDQMNRRIKNIIPKYLRGKVHPAMAKGKKAKEKKKNNTIGYMPKTRKDGIRNENVTVTTENSAAKVTIVGAKITTRHSIKKHKHKKHATTKHNTTAKRTTAKHTTEKHNTTEKDTTEKYTTAKIATENHTTAKQSPATYTTKMYTTLKQTTISVDHTATTKAKIKS